MRTRLLAVGLLALIPAAGRADDAAATVERAVVATANSDLRLRRLETVVRSDRGTLFMPVGEVPVQRTAYFSAPDRLKYDASLTIGGQRQAMVIVLNGLNGWQQSGGEVKDLSAGQFDAVRDGDADAWWLATLLPLRQKGATLKALPAVTVGGKPANGVSVSRPNRPDAQLYFSAETGLLVRVRVTMRETGLDSVREVDLGSHRDFDGIKLPTRITVTQNGRKIEDWTVEGYRTPDRLDDKLFAKPK